MAENSSRNKQKSIAVGVSILSLVTAAACAPTSATGNHSVGQAAMKHIETREVDAPIAQVFTGATEALFDLGFSIKHSDRASGLLVGEKTDARKGKRAAAVTAGVLAFGVAGLLAASMVDPVVYNLTLFIRPVDEDTSTVRIKTSIDGEDNWNRRCAQ